MGGTQGQGGSLIPLNLCYLAAYVRADDPAAKVQILDADAEGLGGDETVRHAADFAPELIGITANTGAFATIVELCRRFKARLPSTPIVLGGPHVSALPERSLRETGADYVVIGEGEVTLSELCASLGASSPELAQIRGLAYLAQDGGFRCNPPRELIRDLDGLPFPARDLVDHRRYQPPPSKRVGLGPNTLVSTSRGCPHNCGFCSARSVWQRGVRTRSPESVVAEIRQCLERFAITSINFADEFFTADRRRLQRLCTRIIDEGLRFPWVCSARAEGLDESSLRVMARAGCSEISFGIESGSPEMLGRMDKKLDLDEALQVVRACRRAGIATHASYIIGYPGETVDTIQATIRFAQRLDTDVAAFFVASPLPGSRLYQQALQDGLLRPDAGWEHYSPLSNHDPVLSLPGLPSHAIRGWHRKALRQYYLRPGYIVRRLARIRHWHEVMNLLAGARLFLSLRR